MNETRKAIECLILAVAIALTGTSAWAGDVTVYGSATVVTQPCENDLAYQLRPSGQTCSLAPPPANSDVAFPERYPESNWYARMDYYHCGMQLPQGTGDTCESGALYTLGFAKDVGHERFRLEFFGGDMHYRYDDTSVGLATSNTNYLGARGEYEYHWIMECIDTHGAPQWEFFAGIGTRVWVNNIQELTFQSGQTANGWDETWWTIYPYIGLEKKWLLHNGCEIFSSGRIGFTLWTYEHASTDDMPALYPNPNITAQIEVGVRRNAISVSAYFEAMTWQRSDAEYRVLSSPPPGSTNYWAYGATQMFTTGLKLTLSY
jgi:hypothetical protein